MWSVHQCNTEDRNNPGSIRIAKMNDSIRVPVWFWIIAVVAVLWNLAGLAAFFFEVTRTPEIIATLPLAHQQLYADTPSWANIGFAIAVFAGVVGSVGLLLKEDWSVPLFAISLLGIIVQQTHMFFLSNTFEVLGNGAMVFPIIVLAIGLLLPWFSHWATKKGWLT